MALTWRRLGESERGTDGFWWRYVRHRLTLYLMGDDAMLRVVLQPPITLRPIGGWWREWKVALTRRSWAYEVTFRWPIGISWIPQLDKLHHEVVLNEVKFDGRWQSREAVEYLLHGERHKDAAAVLGIQQ